MSESWSSLAVRLAESVNGEIMAIMAAGSLVIASRTLPRSFHQLLFKLPERRVAVRAASHCKVCSRECRLSFATSLRSSRRVHRVFAVNFVTLTSKGHYLLADAGDFLLVRTRKERWISECEKWLKSRWKRLRFHSFHFQFFTPFVITRCIFALFIGDEIPRSSLSFLELQRSLLEDHPRHSNRTFWCVFA